MLENLSSINWDAYNHNLDIPDTIRQLTEKDKAIVLKAYNKIFDRVLISREILGTGDPHRAYDVFDSDLVSQIVPFLLEILRMPSILLKEQLVDLLVSIDQIANIIELKPPHKNNADKAITALCKGSPIYLSMIATATNRIQEDLICLLVAAAEYQQGPVVTEDIVSKLLEPSTYNLHRSNLYTLVEAMEDMFKVRQELEEQFRPKFIKIVKDLHQYTLVEPPFEQLKDLLEDIFRKYGIK